MATLKQVAERLAAIAARVSNIKPVLEVVAVDLQDFIDQRFDREEDPQGARWAPHAPSTAARRGPGAKILTDTGNLRGSIFVMAERTSMTLRVGASYGKYHQSGTRKMPRRAFIPVTVSGKPEKTGDGGRFWQDARAAVRKYIVTGETG